VTKKRDTKNYIYIGILLLILFLGIFLRIYNIGYQSLWIDESYSINAAFEILEKGYPLLDSGKWYTKGILHTYSIAFFFLFNVSEAAARFPAMLFGSAMIILSYILCTTLYASRKAGLICAFFIATSYWQIAWSRQARMYTQFMFLFWLSILFFYLWIEKKQNKYLLFFIASSIISYFTHQLTLALLPICGSYYVIRCIYDKQIRKRLWSLHYLIKFTMIAAIICTIAYYIWFYFSVVIPYLHRTTAYIFYYPTFYWQTYFFFLLLAGSSLIFINKYYKQHTLLLLCLIIPYFLIAMFLSYANLRYLFFLTPALFILSAVFLVELKKTHIIGALCAIIIIICLVFTPTLLIKPHTMYRLEPDTPQSQYKTAYTILKENFPDYQKYNYTVAHTAMHRFYLGKKPEYVIRFSFTGIENEWAWNRTSTHDAYTNTTIVKDTVPGTIGIYDYWATTKPGFRASLKDAIRFHDMFIVYKQDE